MVYRIAAVGVIPGINDQVGGNAHGDSDIGVLNLSIFLCNFTYRIWLPSLIKSIPESMHPSSPTCNTSGASVLMRRGQIIGIIIPETIPSPWRYRNTMRHINILTIEHSI